MFTNRLLAVLLLTLSSTGCGGAANHANVPDEKVASKPPENDTATNHRTDTPVGADATPPTAAKEADCKGQTCLEACDKKAEPLTCFKAGQALFLGNDGVTANLNGAAPYFEKACTLKHVEACTLLADMYTATRGITPDTAKALAFNTAGCDLGSGMACEALSRMAESGKGMKRDHAKAIALLIKGCSVDDYRVSTCNALNQANLAKDKDAVKAVAAWKKACEAKDANACLWVERLTTN